VYYKNVQEIFGKRTDTLILLQPNFPKEFIKKSWIYKIRRVSDTKENEPQVTSPLFSFMKYRLALQKHPQAIFGDLSSKIQQVGATWLAQSVERATPDLRFASSSPTLGAEIA